MLKRIFTILITASVLGACHPIEQWDNDTEGNFEAIWTIIDQHYCFFEEKDIDWNAIHDKYRARIYDRMPTYMLFDVCSDMVNELRDGHVNLSSPFATSYYRNWWSDYPQNYNERLVQQYYLDFNYKSLGGTYYGILRDNVGYIRYASFSNSIGEGNLDLLLSELYLCNGIIIDIRDNGGGDMTNVEPWVRRFITERILAGYMINKTGPGHNDFSKPYAYYFDPVDKTRVQWRKPVVVLTNRGTFSAANNFVSIMQYLPTVKIVGDRTGGGSGMPMSLDLPNGWILRLSSVPVLDAKGLDTEFGIMPSAGCKVDLDPDLAIRGIDTMLEKAMEVINNETF